MTVWFSSDHHFGHKRIIELAHRPFDTVEEMNEALIHQHNITVADDDIVYFLGDVVLGGWEKHLPLITRLKGRKILVCGNHDQPFMKRDKDSFGKVFAAYSAVFDEVHLGSIEYEEFVLSHFPYDGDHTEEDRYSGDRPVDEGRVLLHGHVHAEMDQAQITYSQKGTRQIHVGVDGWEGFPVSLENVRRLANWWRDT